MRLRYFPFVLIITFSVLSCTTKENRVKENLILDSLLAYTSVGALQKAFGKDSVVQQLREGKLLADVYVFPYSKWEVTIVLKLNGEFDFVAALNGNAWKTMSGVRPGMTLDEIVALNGGPVKIYKNRSFSMTNKTGPVMDCYFSGVDTVFNADRNLKSIMSDSPKIKGLDVRVSIVALHYAMPPTKYLSLDSLLSYKTRQQVESAFGKENVQADANATSPTLHVFQGTNKELTIETTWDGWCKEVTAIPGTVWRTKSGITLGMTDEDFAQRIYKPFTIHRDGEVSIERGSVHFTGLEDVFSSAPTLMWVEVNSTEGHGVFDVRVSRMTLLYPEISPETASALEGDGKLELLKSLEQINAPWKVDVNMMEHNYEVKEKALGVMEDNTTGNFLLVTASSGYSEEITFLFRTYDANGKFLYKNDSLTTSPAIPGFGHEVYREGCDPLSTSDESGFTLAISEAKNVSLVSWFSYSGCGGNISVKDSTVGQIVNGKLKVDQVFKGEPVKHLNE
jgi:hypothetical protein